MAPETSSLFALLSFGLAMAAQTQLCPQAQLFAIPALRILGLLLLLRRRRALLLVYGNISRVSELGWSVVELRGSTRLAGIDKVGRRDLALLLELLLQQLLLFQLLRRTTLAILANDVLRVVLSYRLKWRLLLWGLVCPKDGLLLLCERVS
jgi:hypothetical protein